MLSYYRYVLTINYQGQMGTFSKPSYFVASKTYLNELNNATMWWRIYNVIAILHMHDSSTEQGIALSDLYSETCLQRPPNGMLLCLLELISVAKGHLAELQKAEIFSKIKLIPSVFIKTHYWISHS